MNFLSFYSFKCELTTFRSANSCKNMIFYGTIQYSLLTVGGGKG